MVDESRVDYQPTQSSHAFGVVRLSRVLGTSKTDQNGYCTYTTTFHRARLFKSNASSKQRTVPWCSDAKAPHQWRNTLTSPIFGGIHVYSFCGSRFSLEN